MELKNKFILDACCGTRMFWFNKKHPNTLYIDIRQEEAGFIKERPALEVNPDIIADFTKLPNELKEHRFKLIVWDVPHFKARKLTGVLLKKYGGLHPETWPSDIKNGFNELWSILEDYGVLLFKFSDYHIKFEDVLKLIPEHPLFFNKVNSSEGKTSTKWFCFMKIPPIAMANAIIDNNWNRVGGFTSPDGDFDTQKSLIAINREADASPNPPKADFG